MLGWEKMKKIWIAVLIISTNSWADDSKSRIDDLVAMDLGKLLTVQIATGIDVDVNKAPAIATVITEQDIKNIGARNLIEVLNTVPGLHVTRTSDSTGPAFAFRGIVSSFSPQALIMINGVSIKSAVRGDNHIVWGEFPVHAIAKIEVLRGPGSALYGADAFSGVINIITKKYSDINNSEVGASVGSFRTFNTWANHGLEVADWSIGLNLEYTSSDGYQSIIDRDAQTLIDETGDSLFANGLLPFDPTDASLAPDAMATSFDALDIWLSAENDKVLMNLGIQERRNVGTGHGVIEALDPAGRLAGYKHLFNAALKPVEIFADTTLEAEVQYYRSSQKIQKNIILLPPGALFGAFPDGLIGNPEWKEDALKLEVKSLYSGFDRHLITLGGGYALQDVYEVTEWKNFNADLSPRTGGLENVSDTSEVYMPETDRENYYFFVQDIYNLSKDLVITAGLRYDHYSDFGTTINPRLAVVWTINEKLTSKFLYGRAFRAPAFAETTVTNNPLALGNPNLNPEIIDTFEVAFNYRVNENWLFDANIFRYEIDDFITFVPDSAALTSVAQNLGRYSGTGIETKIDYLHSKYWTMTINYSYVKAQDDRANRRVGDYPEQIAYMRSN
jgi:outer membrane receptor for ferrienterochelin and colicin